MKFEAGDIVTLKKDQFRHRKETGDTYQIIEVLNETGCDQLVIVKKEKYIDKYGPFRSDTFQYASPVQIAKSRMKHKR